MSKKIGLSDDPIDNKTKECLGLKEHVDGLKHFINLCPTPMTIAIQGDWGTGKTSMMNMLKHELLEHDNQKKIRCLWINAWLFSQFEQQHELSISILKTFIKKINALKPANQTKKILKVLKVFSYSSLKIASNISGHDKLFDTVEELIGNEFNEQVDSGDDASLMGWLKNQLGDLVKKVIEHEKIEKIVIFIDDLDRIAPEKAVEVLEILKLFMDIKNCIFVLAIDF